MDVRRALKLLTFRLPLVAIGRASRTVCVGLDPEVSALLTSRVRAAEQLEERSKAAARARRPADLDREADARSRLVHDILVAFSGPTHPLGAEAAALRDALFPRGLKAHLTLPLVEKVDENERLTHLLARGCHAVTVSQLQLGEVRDELIAANDALRAAVTRPPPPSRRDVEAARRAAQDALVWVVLRRWASLGPAEVLDAEVMAEVMAPVAEEVSRLRQGRAEVAG